jgi:predicted amidophosphoribosyltransferase
MVCPDCGFQNPEGMNFCGECGYKLKQPNDIPSNKFSHPQSYTPKFLVDTILAHKSVIEGERKLAMTANNGWVFEKPFH